MKKKKLPQSIGMYLILLSLAFIVNSCTNDQDDLSACGCTFYPEINQYLPDPLSADDVIGEDTYYSGKELRELNKNCLERCD